MSTTKPRLIYHMYCEGPLGWYQDDRAMLWQFAISCGTPGWEAQAAMLAYEHCYDAARAVAVQYGQPTKLVDDALNPLVRFDATGKIVPAAPASAP